MRPLRHLHRRLPRNYALAVLGWLADSFRLAWGLLYWNARKSWFQIRRGRYPCPCQSPSDSGKAYETHCDACVQWHNARRFRRVCPLLVETADGLRCSANTPEVRPFWGISARYYGGTLLGLYAAGVLAVFIFLRGLGYPVSIVHVAVPPLWYRVGQERGWFFLTRARQAFLAGRTPEGLLYLANAYEFDPSNYEVGLTLAKTYQLGQPHQSDEIYRKLLEQHPERRTLTAQYWVRALLARGDFGQTIPIASAEVRRDPTRANAWMRTLLFATRHAHDDSELKALARGTTPATAAWQPLLQTELLLRAGRKADALRRATEPWPRNAPPFTVVYRAELIAQLGEPLAALDFLIQHRSELDDEAYWTVRLHCLALAGSIQILRAEFQAALLDQPLNQPRLKMMCAQLIRHPDDVLFQRVYEKADSSHMSLNDATAGGWFSLQCTAGAVGDFARLHTLTLRLRQASQTPFAALLQVEGFFRSKLPESSATSFLPFLPVPLEVTYALIDRYSGREGGGSNRATP